ncbi:MAG: penicillin-binding protein 2 [Burkholderiales bacterium]
MNYAPRNPALGLKLEGWRSRLLLVLLCLMFLGLAARAAYLQGIRHDFLRQKGEARYSRVIDLPANRGVVYDRNGEPLAISTPMESVWASPPDVIVNAGQLSKLAKLLGVDRNELEARFHSKHRGFVYLRRQVSPNLAASVTALDIPGVFLRREYRRYYPAGEVMAHVLGFTGIDDNGQEGMELAFQSTLAGLPGAKRVIKDRAGRIVEDVESIKLPQDGKPLTLSIDSKIQYLAYRELKAAVRAHRAQAGAIVVLDAQSGELIALASLPDYNPNNRLHAKATQIRNRPVTDIFEPGSTLKPFTIAAALDYGKVRPDTLISTAPGSYVIGGRTIRDAHPHGKLTVAEVIQKSSNVGSAKIALSLPAEAMWEVFINMGFGAVPHSGLPGEAAGKVRPFKTWRPIEQATMSYGHGISVSLVQLARAYIAFASGGEIKPITLLKSEVPVQGKRIISERTARSVTAMLEMAVQPGGTAPKAQVPGYRVAGKTGTAHKQSGGVYAANRYVSSFVGFAPVSAPRLVIAVMIDEPSAGHHYGGTVAAPVFSKVMGEALRSLAVAPDAPLKEWSDPIDNALEIKEEV